MDIIEIKEMLEMMEKAEDSEVAIATMKDFISAVKNCTQSQLICTLEDTLYDYCMIVNRCPDCNYELVPVSWKEPRGEYMGIPAEEEVSVLKCPECFKTY